MNFIRKNLWGVGFVVILVGAFVAMWAANKNAAIPSADGTAQAQAQFTITADDHVKGAANAKVTLVEFADFQCPACKAYAPVLDQLVTDYPNDLRLVYKYFPLTTIHFRAMAGAQAAQAAALQGKFWEMHDLLFTNQDTWSQEAGTATFEKYATQLGLDLAKFKSDYDSQAVKDVINAQIQQGIGLNVNSTPTMYLDGVKIDNPSSYADFKSLIDAEIAKVSGTAASSTSSVIPASTANNVSAPSTNSNSNGY